MLTIKSNFARFNNRQNEYYTTDDLVKLCKAIITSDIINFRGNISYGYTAGLASQIADKISSNKDSKILIINDLSLHMINELLDRGYKKENIYLAYGKWDANTYNASELTSAYDIMKNVIEHNIVERLNVIKLKEIFRMNIKFDLVIANPPYGKIGANITKKIIDNVDFVEYVNLLPANDYKRNDSKDLYNYQSDMITIKDGFADASVTTHLAKIHKNKVNNMTLDEFERSQYIDRQLDKYFEENSKRTHYAIDRMAAGCHSVKVLESTPWQVNKTFIIGLRDMNHKHLPYSKNCFSYKWNVEESINFNYIITNHANKNGQLLISECVFQTSSEKQNFVSFVYTNFKFMSKVFTALNCDGTVHSIAFPKVDWTRNWTVEEILADYGYTEDEIKEVMEDLKNYKGMED